MSDVQTNPETRPPESDKARSGATSRRARTRHLLATTVLSALLAGLLARGLGARGVFLFLTVAAAGAPSGLMLLRSVLPRLSPVATLPAKTVLDRCRASEPRVRFALLTTMFALCAALFAAGYLAELGRSCFILLGILVLGAIFGCLVWLFCDEGALASAITRNISAFILVGITPNYLAAMLDPSPGDIGHKLDFFATSLREMATKQKDIATRQEVGIELQHDELRIIRAMKEQIEGLPDLDDWQVLIRVEGVLRDIWAYIEQRRGRPETGSFLPLSDALADRLYNLPLRQSDCWAWPSDWWQQSHTDREYQALRDALFSELIDLQIDVRPFMKKGLLCSAWLGRCPKFRQVLEVTDFARTPLTGIGVRDVDLSELDFSRALFGNNRFYHCSFVRSSLRFSRGSLFFGCDFTEADLRSCDLSWSTFDSCKFDGARFDGAEVCGMAIFQPRGLLADQLRNTDDRTFLETDDEQLRKGLNLEPTADMPSCGSDHTLFGTVYRFGQPLPAVPIEIEIRVGAGYDGSRERRRWAYAMTTSSVGQFRLQVPFGAVFRMVAKSDEHVEPPVAVGTVTGDVIQNFFIDPRASAPSPRRVP